MSLSHPRSALRALLPWLCALTVTGCPSALPLSSTPGAGDAPGAMHGGQAGSGDDPMTPPGMDPDSDPMNPSPSCDGTQPDPMQPGMGMDPGGDPMMPPDPGMGGDTMHSGPSCPSDPMLQMTRVELGLDRSCAIADGGTLFCWGRDALGSDDGSALPQIVQGIGPVSDVTLGWDHVCAISDGEVFCWGVNQGGALGDGTNLDRAQPTRVAGLDHVVDIDAGFGFTCAVRDDAALFCWGSGDLGQLGNDPAASANEPVHVLDGAQRVSAGGQHACALLSGGGVRCWGDNTFGQLGDGTTTSRTTPVDTGLQAIDVSAGYDHTCAVLTDHSVRCWGDNASGQLGDDTSGAPLGAGMAIGRSSPVLVHGVDGADSVHAGNDHTCARMQMGYVMCWGSNQFDVLASGAPIDHVALHGETATQLERPVAALAVAPDHACAIYDHAGVVCWGNDQFGQLGDQTHDDALAPVAATGLGCY